MKKNYLLIVILTLLLSCIGSKNAMAATGISASEQTIIDKLKTEVFINGIKQSLPITFVNQVENEFIGNEVDLTKDQAEAITSKMDEAIELISAMDKENMTNVFNSELALKLLTLVGEAADIVDYEVSVDLSSRSIDIKNAEGNTMFLSKKVVNQTGYDSSGIVAAGLLSAWIFGCITLLMRILNHRHWFEL